MSGRRIPLLDGRPPDQIGILVADLDEAVERYARLWGGSPWRIWTYGPETVPSLTFRGEPGVFAVRVALNSLEPQTELLQPLTGPSIYHEWLEGHGEGLHHVAVRVPSLDLAVDQMAESGFPCLQSGSGYGVRGDGGFAYFDTVGVLGVIVEAIEVPAVRVEPERVV